MSEESQTTAMEKVHKGYLFGPPEKTKNTLIIRGAKTKYVYVFIPGAKTLVHEKDAKDLENRNFKKEE